MKIPARLGNHARNPLNPASRAAATGILIFLLFLAFGPTASAALLVQLRGADFKDGAAHIFGGDFYGRQGVNMIYAHPCGEAASMTASFTLDNIPAEPVFLLLDARNDDSPTPCRIQISLNGHEIFSGTNGFSSRRWGTHKFPLNHAFLKSGANTLLISNIEPEGHVGAPPWFMVARCGIGAAHDAFPVVKPPTLRVKLPFEARPFPEPLPPDHPQPGFKFRGSKGWAWTPEQYLAEIPFLASCKMNFLMNCY